MSDPTWRDDLDNLLATAGEAQWVEEVDSRLTALLEGRDSLALKLGRVAELARQGRETSQFTHARAALDEIIKLSEPPR